MLNRVLATLAGIVAAFADVMLIEKLGHIVYPPPDNLDLTDQLQLTEYVAGLPIGALLFVLVAWLAGAFVGALVAGWLSKPRTPVGPIVVTVLVLMASAAQLLVIPHPLWFSIAAFIGIPLAGFLGWKLVPALATPA